MSLLTNLFAYYKLDEASGTALDAAGSRTLTDNGGVGTAAGMIGTARSFNGSTNYLTRTGNFGFGAASGAPFTLAGWLYPDTLGGDYVVLGYYDGGSLFQIEIGTDSTLRAGYGGGTLRFMVSSGPTLVTATWYQFAFTFGATGIGTLYQDGASVYSEVNAPGSFTSTADLDFGRRGGDGIANFPGRLDELGVWDRELSGSEVSSLYNGGAALPFSSFGGQPVARRQRLAPQAVRRASYY